MCVTEKINLLCSPLDVDIAHGVPSNDRDLVQNNVLCVVDHHPQHKLVRFARRDVNWRREGAFLGEYVHPHMQ